MSSWFAIIMVGWFVVGICVGIAATLLVRGGKELSEYERRNADSDPHGLKMISPQRYDSSQELEK